MPLITFSEQSLYTSNPIFNLNNNIVYTWGGIRSDSSNPTSPVLAGSTSSFAPPINVQFKKPVQKVSFDAGYFDDAKSTLIQFYDGNGNIVKSVRNSDQLGIQNFTATSKDGIVGFMVRATAPEANGFAIDNLFVGQLAKIDKPPKIFTTDKGATSVFLGDLDSWEGSAFDDSLGPDDKSDFYSFKLTQKSKVTFEIYLKESPHRVQTFKETYKKGSHKVEIRDVDGYDENKDYVVRIVDVEPTNDAKYDVVAGDFIQTVISGVAINWTDFCLALGETVTDGASAKKLYKEMSKKLGKAAIALDVFFRLDNVLAAKNPAEEFFAQAIDFSVAFAAAQGGGAVGTLLGGPIGTVVGGFGAGLVYSKFASSKVQNEARDFYRDQIGLGNDFAKAGEDADGASDDIPFDEDWYLDTYSDAANAVAAGKYPSAYAHFIAEGAKKGHKPNASDDSLKQKDLVGGGNKGIKKLGEKGSVIDTEFGGLQGDGQSKAEKALVKAILNYRTEGVTLDVDGDLTALANRKAQDLVHNMGKDALSLYLTGNETWDDWWSTGDANEPGARSYFGILNYGLTVMAVASEGISAKDALKLFIQNVGDRAALLDPDNNRIGVAEYGGVWVVVMDNNFSAATEMHKNNGQKVVRSGSDNPDFIALGTWNGNAVGKGGSDILHGGSQNNVLKGGNGSDLIDGHGGNDKILGGKGNDVVIAGKGKDTVIGGKGKDSFVFAPKEGKNTIKDYRDGQDKIDLSAFNFKNKKAALKHFQEVGGAHDNQVKFAFKKTVIEIKGADLGDIGGSDILI